jgi:hypothetical protein
MVLIQTMTLPDIFILDIEQDWVIARTRLDANQLYSFDFFEDPMQILKGGTLQNEDTNQTYTINWKYKTKSLKHTLKYRGKSVKTLHDGVLPVLYDNSWSWFFDKSMTYLETSNLRILRPWSVSKPGDLEDYPWGVPYKVLVPVHEPVVKTVYVKSPPQAHKMPRHLIRLVLDAAISKGDACPITMEPLTRESVVMTPCGHLFEREAIEHSLGCKAECPNCRSAVRREELEGY